MQVTRLGSTPVPGLDPCAERARGPGSVVTQGGTLERTPHLDEHPFCIARRRFDVIGAGLEEDLLLPLLLLLLLLLFFVVETPATDYDRELWKCASADACRDVGTGSSRPEPGPRCGRARGAVLGNPGDHFGREHRGSDHLDSILRRVKQLWHHLESCAYGSSGGRRAGPASENGTVCHSDGNQRAGATVAGGPFMSPSPPGPEHGGVPLDVEKSEGHAAGSGTGARWTTAACRAASRAPA
jgi:hypothetical protein